MEKCYGCGGEAEKHPVVGIIHKDDVEAGTTVMINPNEASPFVGVTICEKCHRDPEHRTAQSLKCHFQMRADMKKVMVGLIMAGSNDIET